MVSRITYLLVTVAVAVVIIGMILYMGIYQGMQAESISNSSSKIEHGASSVILEKNVSVELSTDNPVIYVDAILTKKAITISSDGLAKVKLVIEPHGSLSFVKTDNYTSSYVKVMYINGEDTVQLQYTFNPYLPYSRNYTISAYVVTESGEILADELNLTVQYDISFVMSMIPEGGMKRTIVFDDSMHQQIIATIKESPPTSSNTYPLYLQYVRNRFASPVIMEVQFAGGVGDYNDISVEVLRGESVIGSFPLWSTYNLTIDSLGELCLVPRYTGSNIEQFKGADVILKYTLYNTDGAKLGETSVRYLIEQNMLYYVSMEGFVVYFPIGDQDDAGGIISTITQHKFMVSLGTDLADITPFPGEIGSPSSPYAYTFSEYTIAGSYIREVYDSRYDFDSSPVKAYIAVYRDYLCPSSQQVKIVKTMFFLKERTATGEYSWINKMKVDDIGLLTIDSVRNALYAKFRLYYPSSVREIDINHKSVAIQLVAYNGTIDSTTGRLDFFNYPIASYTPKEPLLVFDRGTFFDDPSDYGALYFSCLVGDTLMFGEPWPDPNSDHFIRTASHKAAEYTNFLYYDEFEISGIDLDENGKNHVGYYINNEEDFESQGYYLKYMVVSIMMDTDFVYTTGTRERVYILTEIIIPLGDPQNDDSFIGIAKQYRQNAGAYEDCISLVNSGGRTEIVCELPH